MTTSGALTIGVTGHRSFRNRDGVADRVDGILDQLLAEHDRPALDVWSALAEGADRLVVERVMERVGARLCVVLPLPADDYRTDFGDPSSVAEFDRWFATAAEIAVTGPDDSGTRESAYERAGLAVVDRCEVLLALWDGRPSRGRGGTAEIVDAARHRGRCTIVIDVERPVDGRRA